MTKAPGNETGNALGKLAFCIPFWNKDECAVEYHPPLSQNVKVNPYCLHLWRPKHATIPLPAVSIVLRGF
jgi:hypothetical protein